MRNDYTCLTVFFPPRPFLALGNQDVLDLIDRPRTGILKILDEQCIVDWGTERKFSLSLYSTCEKAGQRFHVSSAQRVRNKFAIEHYAGFVEYSTENWLEKNRDQLPAASAELLESSDFELIGKIKVNPLKRLVSTQGMLMTRVS